MDLEAKEDIPCPNGFEENKGQGNAVIVAEDGTQHGPKFIKRRDDGHAEVLAVMNLPTMG